MIHYNVSIVTDPLPTTAFNLDADIIYLNHAAVAPWPIKTVEAVQAFAREASQSGAKYYDRWIETESRLREQLARFINAQNPHEIALLKNTSEGLSVIAYGLDWLPGDNVVFAEEEFPSNRIVWESLQHRGVDAKRVALLIADDPEQALIEQFDSRTRLLSVSSVQYASGLKLDLEKLGRACRDANVLFCVDAIQSVGALQFDAQAFNADFVVADGHKWLLGPEGIALFYCRAEVMDRISLNQFGWHMMDNPWDFDHIDSWQPSRTATRFECGSPNMLGIHALKASLDVLEDTGLDKVEQRVLDNTHFLNELLGKNEKISILSPLEKDRYAGIVTFRHADIEPETLYWLLRKSGVICAVRGGGIRLSPHFYTPKSQLQKTVELITQFTEY